MKLAGLVRDTSIDVRVLCLSLAGPAKPQTFLWSYTSLMAVELTYELELGPNRIKTKNRTAIVTSVI